MENRGNWKRQAVLFFASQCVTLFGSQVVQMAIVWYVTLATDSGAWVAAFSLCAYLPQFFVSFIGGVWADRYHRKTLIVGADALIAAVTLVMMLMMPHMTDEPVLLAALLLMSIVRSAGAGIQNPAVNAVVAQLVPEEQLMRYNGIHAAMQSMVQFGAPAAAAVMLTMSTLRTTLIVDVATAVVGIGIFSFVHLPKQKEAQNASSVFYDAWSGLRYAYRHVIVRKTLIIYGCFVFFTIPAGYLSGLLVSRVFGDTYWYLTAVELVGFGGMMLGGLLMSLWGRFRNRRRTLATGLYMFGAMAIGMGISHRFAWYLVFMLLYGVALTIVQTTMTTMLQANSDHALLGRVLGLMSSIYAGCYPAGMALFGPLADRMPLRWIMNLSGVALMMAGAYCEIQLKEKRKKTD